MRLTMIILIFALFTALSGFTGIAGQATDYFRILSVIFLVMFVFRLFGRKRHHTKVKPHPTT
jgi:uncharacterized membrane protein YtjA (UPF0391 family)